MKTSEFIKECCLSGPGLDGYAYNADVYCPDCAYSIIENIASKIAPLIEDTNDPQFLDSNLIPQPIFFGEAYSVQHCSDCGACLYGKNEE